MTNEQKERLKEIIDSLLNSNMGTTGELNYQEMMWFQETIHSLIDRVPSEEEALDMMHDIKWFMSNCRHQSELSEFIKCDYCFNFKHCELKIDAIRKALGIKGKE